MNTKDLSKKKSDSENNEITKHYWEEEHNFTWDQKKVDDRESRLIPWKIKESIHSSKNPYYINKILHMFP